MVGSAGCRGIGSAEVDLGERAGDRTPPPFALVKGITRSAVARTSCEGWPPRIAADLLSGFSASNPSSPLFGAPMEGYRGKPPF